MNMLRWPNDLAQLNREDRINALRAWAESSPQAAATVLEALVSPQTELTVDLVNSVLATIKPRPTTGVFDRLEHAAVRGLGRIV